MPDTFPALADDLLRGAANIAAFTGDSERAVYHKLEKRQLLGAFRMGTRWCLRKSTHLRLIEALERGAQRDGAEQGGK